MAKYKETATKKQKEQYSQLLKYKIPRNVKERYLIQTGLFKKEAVKKMSDTQLNELVEAGLETKGFPL